MKTKKSGSFFLGGIFFILYVFAAVNASADVRFPEDGKTEDRIRAGFPLLFKISNAGAGNASSDYFDASAAFISLGSKDLPAFIMPEKKKNGLKLYYFMEGETRETEEYRETGLKQNENHESSYFDIKGVYIFDAADNIKLKASAGYSYMNKKMRRVKDTFFPMDFISETARRNILYSRYNFRFGFFLRLSEKYKVYLGMKNPGKGPPFYKGRAFMMSFEEMGLDVFEELLRGGFSYAKDSETVSEEAEYVTTGSCKRRVDTAGIGAAGGLIYKDRERINAEFFINTDFFITAEMSETLSVRTVNPWFPEQMTKTARDGYEYIKDGKGADLSARVETFLFEDRQFLYADLSRSEADYYPPEFYPVKEKIYLDSYEAGLKYFFKTKDIEVPVSLETGGTASKITGISERSGYRAFYHACFSGGVVYKPGSGVSLSWAGKITYAGAFGDINTDPYKDGFEVYDWSMMFGAGYKTQKIHLELQMNNSSVYSGGYIKNIEGWTGRATAVRIYMKFFL